MTLREDNPQVDTVAFAIGTATEIDGTLHTAGDGAAEQYRVSATAVDVTIKNSGNEPELITELRVVLHEVTSSCATGGGGVTIEAEYDFRTPPSLFDTPMPQTYTKSVLFESQPNRVDRLRVTLGPEEVEGGVAAVTFYAFDLFAVTASNPDRPLLLGQGKMASPKDEVPTFIRDFDEIASFEYSRECMAELAADLRHMESLPGATSPEYRAVMERMRTQNSIRTQNPTPEPQPTELPTGVNSEDAALDQLNQLIASDRPEVQRQLAETWVPQLSSKQPGLVVDGISYEYINILNDHLGLRATYDARLAWSGEWSSFQEGDFYVTVATEPFNTPDEANSWCDRQGFRAEHCFAKRLSTVTGHTGSIVSR